MRNIPLQNRLTALQSGHLPQPILDYIEDDLAGASADEINRRVTRDYLAAAARQAIVKRKTAIQPETRQ